MLIVALSKVYTLNLYSYIFAIVVFAMLHAVHVLVKAHSETRWTPQRQARSLLDDTVDEQAPWRS